MMLQRAMGLTMLLCGLVVAPLAAGQINNAQGKVTGTVAYLQRMALQPDAVVKVTLQDVSQADSPAKTIAEIEIPTAGKQVPIPFELSYSAASIVPSHRYQVRATISSGGQMIFTSTTAYPVITQAAPMHVEIMVQQVHGSSQGPDGRPMVTLTETYWKLTELNGKAIKVPQGAEAAHIVLHTEGKKVGAFGGCNRMFGTYELSGSSLRFGAMGSTMMACAEPIMKQEGLFNKALQATNGYSISGETLELRDEKKALARFHAEAMK